MGLRCVPIFPQNALDAQAIGIKPRGTFYDTTFAGVYLKSLLVIAWNAPHFGTQMFYDRYKNSFNVELGIFAVIYLFVDNTWKLIGTVELKRKKEIAKSNHK